MHRLPCTQETPAANLLLASRIKLMVRLHQTNGLQWLGMSSCCGACPCGLADKESWLILKGCTAAEQGKAHLACSQHSHTGSTLQLIRDALVLVAGYWSV